MSLYNSGHICSLNLFLHHSSTTCCFLLPIATLLYLVTNYQAEFFREIQVGFISRLYNQCYETLYSHKDLRIAMQEMADNKKSLGVFDNFLETWGDTVVNT